ncbi:MAG TPA: hypothetical protein VMQ76_07260 [Terracidiphilus sp.]|nr:hypothetical protein [Terracidiphilus sp.]
MTTLVWCIISIAAYWIGFGWGWYCHKDRCKFRTEVIPDDRFFQN